MPTRRTILISSVMASLLVVPVALSQRASRAELRFQEAHRKETIDGDLKSAIVLYRKAIDEAGSDRLIAAQALVRMGECYEKLGDTEARKAYERVVRDFGDQKDPAETARTRLSALERAGSLGHPLGVTLRRVWEGGANGLVEGSPSPDGRYLSFRDWETGDLALRDLVTGQTRRLTNKGSWKDSGEYAAGSVISCDGKQIAYAWYNKENYFELRVIGMDGSNPRTIYRDKEFGFWIEPWQWTTDGRQILAAIMKGNYEETRIALIPIAGESARFLKTQAQLPWYPSLSPDGRFLVYSAPTAPGREGDIFILPLEGGPEIPLVRQPANDWGPVWVPDGSKVLFISDRTGTKAFWTIEVVDGRSRGVPQLLHDGLGRAVRPNGFTRQGAFYYSTSTNIRDIYITELNLLEGKIIRQPELVTPRPSGTNLAPSWSPDGRRLAYYSQRGGDLEDDPATLVIFSMETGEARDVPVKLEPYLVHVHWFPDGKSVLVGAWESSKHDSIGFYRVDLQTGDYRLILSSPGPGIGHAELSPDGKTLFFFSPGEPELRVGIVSRDVESGKERELARVPYLAGTGWARLAVSPDGTYLTFRSPVDESQWTALRLLPARGGELRELCRFRQSETADFTELAWTPDGRNVLVVRRTGKDGTPELWRIPIAGGEPQRTGLSVESMGIVAPHPDGRRIAFDCGSRRGSTSEVWVLENFLR